MAARADPPHLRSLEDRRADPGRARRAASSARAISTSASRYARQVFFGTLDLAIHGAEDVDAVDAMRDAYRVTALDYPEDTFFLAGFGHVMGGYDAGYYGYLWAEVIGDDMFGRFLNEGLLSPEVGRDYRREILEPNGTRPADAMVRAFLGREPSNRAFLEMRGMPTS